MHTGITIKEEIKMPFKDIREFISKLEKEGEAQRIDEEVDWYLEAGAILHRATEQDLPTPLLQNCFKRLKTIPVDTHCQLLVIFSIMNPKEVMLS